MRKEFQTSFEKHIDYLSQNIENQDNYSSKLSEILQKMEIFDSENDEDKKENKENENLNNENNNQDDQNQSKDEKNVQASSPLRVDQFSTISYPFC